MKKSISIVFIAFFLNTGVAQFRSHLPIEKVIEAEIKDDEQAIAAANRAVDEYAQLSRMYTDDGVDLGNEFIALFGLDAKVPMDYRLSGLGNRLLSPSEYVTDYQGSVDKTPIQVITSILHSATTVTDIGGGEDKRVSVRVLRSYEALLTDSTEVSFKKPKERTFDILLIVRADGGVKIDGIRATPILELPHWIIDIDLGRSIEEVGFSSATKQGIMGAEESAFQMTMAGARLSRRIRPFDRPGVKTSATSFYVGLGLRYQSFAMPALSLRSVERDYIEDDQVVFLATGVEINDAPGSDDFVRVVEVEYASDNPSYVSGEGALAASFEVHGGEKASTFLELGGGVLFGAEKTFEVFPVSSYQVRYSEGPFSETPVFINEEGVFYGALFQEYSDPYGIYGYASDGLVVERSIRLATSPFVDLKLIESIHTESFDIGLVLGLRAQLTDLIERNEEKVSLSSSIRNGISPLSAYSSEINPTYITLGIRLDL